MCRLRTASSTSGRECTLSYCWTHSVGLSRARNAGISAAKHDSLVFTDDDVSVTPTWFGSIARALIEAGFRSVVTGRVLPSMEQMPGGFAPAIQVDEAAAIYQGRPGEDVLLAGNMALYRATLKDIGLFDVRLGAGSSFPGAEDNDFGFRLLEAGYRIIYAPQAALYHRAWRGPEYYLPMRWNYAFSQGAFYAKYFSLHDRYMLGRMRADLGRHASRLVRYGLRRSRRQTYADAIYTLGLLCGAARWLLTQPKER